MYFVCGRDSMFSLVGKKLPKEKSYKKHTIETSLQCNLHFGHSKFILLDGAKPTCLRILLDPNGQKMYNIIT